MLTPERTALILLAAGRSLRFTDADKLAEPFLDKPLAFHVVTALENIPFLTRIAVVSDTGLDFAARGYRVEANPDPSLGQARSLCHGVSVAREAGADAVLVALADMPAADQLAPAFVALEIEQIVEQIPAEQCRRPTGSTRSSRRVTAPSRGRRHCSAGICSTICSISRATKAGAS
jgi:CTP:molybdopterin cytidylyltransferase MocA